MSGIHQNCLPRTQGLLERDWAARDLGAGVHFLGSWRPPPGWGSPPFYTEDDGRMVGGKVVPGVVLRSDLRMGLISVIASGAL